MGVIHLSQCRRRRRAPLPGVGQQGLGVQAHAGAVSLDLDDERTAWASPEQAEELADRLLRAAAEARRLDAPKSDTWQPKGRPRG